MIVSLIVIGDDQKLRFIGGPAKRSDFHPGLQNPRLVEKIYLFAFLGIDYAGG